MKGRKLFGTDGVRGVAGEPPLDPATVHALGMALGDIARGLAEQPEVVIGMDTRESSPWLANQVAGGLVERGATVRCAGVTTTPGVAYLTRTNHFVAGVMISASHNPYRDNGIKIFGHSGHKLSDEQERAIERAIFAFLEAGLTPAPAAVAADPSLDRHYVDFLASTVKRRFDGLDIVVDCGNGAASALAPGLFRSLGARVHPLSCSPDGRNINLDCGALHAGRVRLAVLERGASMGVAFDGDADRAMFVSRSGKIVDGDAVMLISGRALHAQGRLTGPGGRPTVVATVMSNIGLERALAGSGIAMLRTPVGDRYVLEEMLKTGAVLGGEQSGHVIFSEYATTGDGLLTALRVIETSIASGQGLDELTSDFVVFPQRLVNVRVKVRKPVDQMPAVAAEIQAAEQAFGERGRVLVRYSGTEPLARVMIEGPDMAQVDDWTGRIAAAFQREIGE
jgi:phosphoglucosamine mutase